jgi:hypothetical protein
MVVCHGQPSPVKNSRTKSGGLQQMENDGMSWNNRFARVGMRDIQIKTTEHQMANHPAWAAAPAVGRCCVELRAPPPRGQGE